MAPYRAMLDTGAVVPDLSQDKSEHLLAECVLDEQWLVSPVGAFECGPELGAGHLRGLGGAESPLQHQPNRSCGRRSRRRDRLALRMKGVQRHPS